MAAIIKVLKNEKGSVLMYTLMIFFVVFILSMSVIAIFSSNLKQTKYQENKMEAHYLSYSGALMGYSALTTDGFPSGTDTLLEEMLNDKNKTFDQENIKIFNDADKDRGYIDIEVRTATVGTYTDWIEITSTGTLGTKASPDISAKTILYINPNDSNDIKWNAY